MKFSTLILVVVCLMFSCQKEIELFKPPIFGLEVKRITAPYVSFKVMGGNVKEAEGGWQAVGAHMVLVMEIREDTVIDKPERSRRLAVANGWIVIDNEIFLKENSYPFTMIYEGYDSINIRMDIGKLKVDSLGFNYWRIK